MTPTKAFSSRVRREKDFESHPKSRGYKLRIASKIARLRDPTLQMYNGVMKFGPTFWLSIVTLLFLNYSSNSSDIGFPQDIYRSDGTLALMNVFIDLFLLVTLPLGLDYAQRKGWIKG